MRSFLIFIVLLSFFSLSANASDFSAPPAPNSVQDWMPATNSFAEGLHELMTKAVNRLLPEIREAFKATAVLLATVLAVSLIPSIRNEASELAQLVGTLGVCGSLLFSTNSMIQLSSQTVTEISEYGKLLLPVMTAAMAAQGGITASAALYTGTAAFNTLLTELICHALLPMVYIFLGLAAANAATGDNLLKNMRDVIKNMLSWILKTLLTVFTTYISITGVISGTTDAAALKATKVTISSVVPVVGGILSDASEAVLVSAGMAKNAAGIYGIFAVLALFAMPFLKIGVQYVMLKFTSALCGIFGPKRITELLGDFSSAMGLLLSMTGSVCLLQLISTTCFLRGVS